MIETPPSAITKPEPSNSVTHSRRTNISNIKDESWPFMFAYFQRR